MANKVSQCKRADKKRFHQDISFFDPFGVPSFSRGAVKKFVRLCTKNKPCDIENGNTKLFGISVIDTKFVISIPNVP